MPRVVPSDDDVRAAAKVVAAAGLSPGGLHAVVHAGASARGRVWEGLPETAAWVEERLRLPVLVNIGPVEADRGLGAGWPSSMRTVGPLEAGTLAGLLAGAAVYVGGDTGPTHVAAAVGTATVAVFGPESDVHLWGPRGRRVTTVTGDGSGDWPAAARVREAVQEWLAGSTA